MFDSANNNTKRAFASSDGASVVINTLNLQKDKVKCLTIYGWY